MASAFFAACAVRSSWIAYAMFSAPSGNNVNSVNSPMAMTKIATSTSTSVVPPRFSRPIRPLIVLPFSGHNSQLLPTNPVPTVYAKANN